MSWLGNYFLVHFPIGRILRYKNDLFISNEKSCLQRTAHTYISSLSLSPTTRGDAVYGL